MDDAGRVLARAEELAQDFLAGLGERPVWPRATFEEMLAAFDGPLPESGADPVAVVEELAGTADTGLAGTAGPRFFGFVIGGHLPAAARRRRADVHLGPERRSQLARPPPPRPSRWWRAAGWSTRWVCPPARRSAWSPAG